MNENNPVSLCKLLRRCDVAWTNFNFCFLMFYLHVFWKREIHLNFQRKFKRSQMLPKNTAKNVNFTK